MLSYFGISSEDRAARFCPESWLSSMGALPANDVAASSQMTGSGMFKGTDADSVLATEVPVTEEKPGDSRPHREIFDSVAWRLLAEMHLHLEDAGLLMEYINSLQKLRDHFNGQSINRWCLFGGCGISSKLAAVYSEFLHEEFGLDVGYDTKVFAELKESKRTFLKTEHPTTEFLVSDCTSLASSAAPNELSD